MKTSRNVIVGIFAALGLVLFVIATVSLGSWSFLSDRVAYDVSFVRVNKLQIGSPVSADGVPVGEVTNLNHVGGDRPVVVTIRINRELKLYPDAQVRVTAAPVIGETEVQIKQGTPQSGDPLVPGSEISGDAAQGVEELAAEVSEELTRTLRAISDILTDDGNRANIKTTVANLAEITGRMQHTFDTINREFEPTLTEARAATVKLNALLDSAKLLTDQATQEIGATRGEASAALTAWTQTARDVSREIEATSIKMQAISDDLHQIVSTSRDPLNRTLNGITEASENLSKVVNAMLNGSGTLGMLINDPRPFNDLQRVLNSVAERLAGTQPSAFTIPGSGAQPGRTPPGGAPQK